MLENIYMMLENSMMIGNTYMMLENSMMIGNICMMIGNSMMIGNTYMMLENSMMIGNSMSLENTLQIQEEDYSEKRCRVKMPAKTLKKIAKYIYAPFYNKGKRDACQRHHLRGDDCSHAIGMILSFIDNILWGLVLRNQMS
jgi:nitrogen fixation/metabolism regulation signal transduction histidine kinase